MINIWQSEVIFDIDALKEEVTALEVKTTSNTFWNNRAQANSILKKIKKINDVIDFYNLLSNQYELIQLYLNENVEKSKLFINEFSKLYYQGIDFSKNDTSTILDSSIVTKINNWDKELKHNLKHILKRYKDNASWSKESDNNLVWWWFIIS